MRLNRGVGLIPVLIFLAIFSMVSMGIFEKVLWEHRTERLYEEKIRSFYLAEECLIQGERSVYEDVIISGGCFAATLFKEEYQCGVDLYTVVARGSYGDSVTTLRSVIAKNNGNSNCKVADGQTLAVGRISFLWYNNS